MSEHEPGTPTAEEIASLWRREAHDPDNGWTAADWIDRCLSALDALDRERERAERAEAAVVIMREAGAVEHVKRNQAEAAIERVRQAIDQEHSRGCYYRHQQGQTDECCSCTAFRIEEALDPPGTEQEGGA
jgi:hypothetical protein